MCPLYETLSDSTTPVRPLAPSRTADARAEIDEMPLNVADLI